METPPKISQVAPFNTMKGGIETMISKLSFKRGVQKHIKKQFEASLDKWRQRMEPKECETFIRTRIHGFDMTIYAYEDCISKLEEILVRTGHLTFKLRACKHPGCFNKFPPVNSITRFCIKHEKRTEENVQAQSEINSNNS